MSAIRQEEPTSQARAPWQKLADTARSDPKTWYSMPVNQRSTKTDLTRGRISAFAEDIGNWEARTAISGDGELRIYVRYWPEGSPA